MNFGFRVEQWVSILGVRSILSLFLAPGVDTHYTATITAFPAVLTTTATTTTTCSSSSNNNNNSKSSSCWYCCSYRLILRSFCHCNCYSSYCRCYGYNMLQQDTDYTPNAMIIVVANDRDNDNANSFYTQQQR